MILCLISSNIDQDLSRCLASIKNSKSVLGLTHVDSRARASRLHLALEWSQAIWIRFGSSRLEDEDRQEDLHLGLFSFYLDLCKDRIVLICSSIHTQKFKTFDFGLTGFGFSGIYIKFSWIDRIETSLYGLCVYWISSIYNDDSYWLEKLTLINLAHVF